MAVCALGQIGYSIGRRVCVGDESHMGEEAIVGAGPAITNGVPPGTVVVGIPPRLLCGVRGDAR